MSYNAPTLLRRLAAAVASMVTLVALVIGVPLLLWRLVGWPLPAELPSLETAKQALTANTVSDTVIVNAIALLGWCGWALLFWSILTETWATLRGRPARPARFASPLQTLTRQLVTSISLLAVTGITTTTIAAAASPATASPASPALVGAGETVSNVDIVTNDIAAGVSAVTDTSAPTVQPSAAEDPTVTVQRHDSYWAIAERTLGDGFRWREIHELNLGRVLADGAVITADTLHPGWILLLPAGATSGPTSTTPNPPPEDHGDSNGVSTVVVETGDNLWTISEDRLELDLGPDPTDADIAPYWQQVIDANQDRYLQPGNPSLIHAGQVIVLPATGHEPPAPPPPEITPDPEPPNDVVGQTSDPPPPVPTPPTADGPATISESTNRTTTTTVVAGDADTSRTTVAPTASVNNTDRTDEDVSLGPVLPAALAIGGLSSVALAVGLKRLLDRRRRRSANEHPGRLTTPTPPDQRDLHRAIVTQADEERVTDLQTALGHLAASLAGSSSGRRPRLIRHSTDSLEVLLDQPDTNAPAGWTSTQGGTVWTLADPPGLDDGGDSTPNAAPLTVSVGQPDGDAQLYLDLEADSLTALTGDQDVATNLARSIITELTLSPLADTLRVVVVGHLIEDHANALEHLTIVDSWDDIADELIAWATQSHDALVDNGWATTFTGRVHDPDHDALVPLAIVADHPPSAKLSDALRNMLPCAVTVVAVGAFPGAAATVECALDALHFDVIDIACAPQEVTSDELADMSRLLDRTDGPAENELIDQSDAGHGPAVGSDGSEPDTGDRHKYKPEADVLTEPPEYDVLARLLCEITVDGGEPLKPKATSVVAFIALNRSVSTERLEEACWFGSDGLSHRKRLRDVMTESRTALGSHHLPANRNGTYTAGQRLRTDVEVFEWHVQRAAHVGPDDAVVHYRAALDLVTGKPFSYPNASRASYGWVDFEHHATTWEYRVAHIAQACAELHLDADQPGDAIDLLRRIARVIPLNSTVIETLMRAHIADNDHTGATRVYEEHATALEQAKLGDPADSIEQLRLDLQAS